MNNLFMFFGWFFDAIWEFFKIPFPMLNVSIGAVLIGMTCAYFGFRLLSIMLSVSISVADPPASETSSSTDLVPYDYRIRF